MAEKEPNESMHETAGEQAELRRAIFSKSAETSDKKTYIKFRCAIPKFNVDGPISIPFVCAVAWRGSGAEVLAAIAALGIFFMTCAFNSAEGSPDRASKYKILTANISALVSLGFLVCASFDMFLYIHSLAQSLAHLYIFDPS